MNLESLIREAANTPPIDVEAYYSKAYAEYQANLTHEAAETFSVLCARKPLESRFWVGLGASLQACTQYEKALYAWAMAAILDPENPFPHFHAAECCDSLNQSTDALKALAEAKKRVKDPSHRLYKPIRLLEETWRNR